MPLMPTQSTELRTTDQEECYYKTDGKEKNQNNRRTSAPDISMSGSKSMEFELDDNAMLKAQNMFIEIESPTGENPKMTFAITPQNYA